MIHNLYIVMGPNGWGYPKIRRTGKKQPNLKADEVAFKLVIDLPRDILNPASIDVKLTGQNIIRPTPKVTEG